MLLKSVIEEVEQLVSDSKNNKMGSNDSDKGIEFEYRLTLLEIEAVLAELKRSCDNTTMADSQTLKPLIDMLDNRDLRVTGTDAVGFIKTSSRANTLSYDLADVITALVGIPVFELLYPRAIGKMMLTKDTMHQFIIGTDHQVIHIRGSFHCVEISGRLMANLGEVWSNRELDNIERELIRNHSSFAKEYDDAIKNKSTYTHQKKFAFIQAITSRQYTVSATYGEVGQQLLMQRLFANKLLFPNPIENSEQLFERLNTEIPREYWQIFLEGIDVQSLKHILLDDKTLDQELIDKTSAGDGLVTEGAYFSCLKTIHHKEAESSMLMPWFLSGKKPIASRDDIIELFDSNKTHPQLFNFLILIKSSHPKMLFSKREDLFEILAQYIIPFDWSTFLTGFNQQFLKELVLGNKTLHEVLVEKYTYGDLIVDKAYIACLTSVYINQMEQRESQYEPMMNALLPQSLSGSRFTQFGVPRDDKIAAARAFLDFVTSKDDFKSLPQHLETPALQRHVPALFDFNSLKSSSRLHRLVSLAMERPATLANVI